jgi:hypothetical protein
MSAIRPRARSWRNSTTTRPKANRQVRLSGTRSQAYSSDSATRRVHTIGRVHWGRDLHTDSSQSSITLRLNSPKCSCASRQAPDVPAHSAVANSSRVCGRSWRHNIRNGRLSTSSSPSSPDLGSAPSTLARVPAVGANHMQYLAERYVAD